MSRNLGILLANFIVVVSAQIYKMESEEGTKPSQVDRIFKQALREFKDNLVATYSVVNKQGVEVLNIKYKDLIANFLHVRPSLLPNSQPCFRMIKRC